MQLLQLTSYKAICSLLTHAVETHVERLEELALRRVRSHPHLDQQAVQAALQHRLHSSPSAEPRAASSSLRCLSFMRSKGRSPPALMAVLSKAA